MTRTRGAALTPLFPRAVQRPHTHTYTHTHTHTHTLTHSHTHVHTLTHSLRHHHRGGSGGLARLLLLLCPDPPCPRCGPDTLLRLGLERPGTVRVWSSYETRDGAWSSYETRDGACVVLERDQVRWVCGTRTRPRTVGVWYECEDEKCGVLDEFLYTPDGPN